MKASMSAKSQRSKNKTTGSEYNDAESDDDGKMDKDVLPKL